MANNSIAIQIKIDNASAVASLKSLGTIANDIVSQMRNAFNSVLSEKAQRVSAPKIDFTSVDNEVKKLAVTLNKLDTEFAETNKGALNLNTTLDSGESKFGKFGSRIISVNQALEAFSKVKEFLSKPIEIAGDFEQSKISFEILLGDAQKATTLLQNLKTLAQTTPLELPGLQENAKLLLSFNVAQEKILPTLKTLGDISGGNAEKMNSLTLAFAQMSSAGRLTGQDLMQMINAGFNPLQVMSEKTGKSIQQLRTDMERGAITSTMVQDAFTAAASEGGKFFGMMDKQGKSLNGMIAQMQDSFSNLALQLGNVLMPVIKELVNAITSSANLFGMLPDSIKLIVASLGTLSVAALLLNSSLGGLPYILIGITTAVTGLSAGLQNGDPVIVAVAASVGALSIALTVMSIKGALASEVISKTLIPAIAKLGITLNAATLGWTLIIAGVAALAAMAIMKLTESSRIAEKEAHSSANAITGVVTDAINKISSLPPAKARIEWEWQMKDLDSEITRLIDKRSKLVRGGASQSEINKVDAELAAAIAGYEKLTAAQNMNSDSAKKNKNTPVHSLTEAEDIRLNLQKRTIELMTNDNKKKIALINNEYETEINNLYKSNLTRTEIHDQAVELEKLRNKKLSDLNNENAEKERKLSAEQKKFVLETAQKITIAELSNAEKLVLSQTKNETERLKITKQFALQRIQTELETALKILDIEELNAKKIKDKTKRDAALTDIGNRRTEATNSARIKTDAANTDYTVGVNTNAQKSADEIKAITKEISDERDKEKLKEKISASFGFELDEQIAKSKQRLRSIEQNLMSEKDEARRKDLQAERASVKEKINLINAEQKAREEQTAQAMLSAAQQFDASKSLGEQMKMITRDTIKRLIAEAVINQLAKVFAMIPFPLNLISAPAAGLAVQAMIEKAVPKFAQGKVGIGEDGVIYGPGTETSDSIPALLSKSETILSAERTRQYRRTLSSIFKGTFPRIFESGNVMQFADGFLPSFEMPNISQVTNMSVGSSGSGVSEQLEKAIKSLERKISKMKIQNFIRAETVPAKFSEAEDDAARYRAAIALG